MNVNFHSCIHDWCYQKGTKGQYTRCTTVSNDGRTCYNPKIRYGSTIGGKPGEITQRNIKEWCKQLFPTYYYKVQVQSNYRHKIRVTATYRVTYLVFLLLKVSWGM